MKLATISFGLLGLFATSASAAYCTDNEYYCGWNLLDKGNYMPEIVAALLGAGITSPTEFQIQHTLFYCRDDADRGVGYAMPCQKQCYETSESDFCDEVGPVMRMGVCCALEVGDEALV
ncbi:hypothetical protein P170DRAFT_469556 [Aspergillus steynii IBT 23096]|uniref:Uncharacterized protein n=1 Tax=Aspergillus steynii IBT 23096 TaxID=1392250 RepID=A0A2I2GML7_9EURO|nr:uncharacterized protein P170DRAFT_469556 [Aspergillus steynii IBT 23096]PLB54089.1 hypothetical protein P170DRAFT_469556 [Aspergillus steynii IBT 23096]